MGQTVSLTVLDCRQIHFTQQRLQNDTSNYAIPFNPQFVVTTNFKCLRKKQQQTLRTKTTY